MKTFYSPAHLGHDPRAQFEHGQLLPAVEIPARAERVRAEIEARKIGPVVAPAKAPDEAILRVHDAGLVELLAEAHAEWAKRYGDTAALPSAWPAHGLRNIRQGDIETRLGAYSFSTDTPIVRGTWPAAREAVNVVLSAAAAVREGEPGAFALTRPPGHHASGDLFGGFCYLNNIAVAAQFLVDAGLKPAVLDVDYHHGNGTQSIFYARRDVFFCSLHADPRYAYPHFLGFADERGEGQGEGANLNLPLPEHSDWTVYEDALNRAIEAVSASAPDVVLVSLGLDTFMDDPIGGFRLAPDDYLRLGERIAALGCPTVFVFEGGYDVESLGKITVNVLEGFESRR